MHTTASDGFYTAQQVLDHVARLGTLDVIAITDHDTLDASLWAYANRARYPFDIIPGVEVSSAAGHVLALWVTRPIPAGLSLAETAAAIHEQGGLAVLAHPFELVVCTAAALRHLRRPQQVRQAGIDAIEIHNAGALTPGNNLLARRLARQLALPALGSSDAHSLQAVGRGVTLFEGRTAADFRQALLSRATAVEGAGWPLRDYWKLIPNMVEHRFGGRLRAANRLSGPLHP
ncbi:MAG: phosphotransferase [Chloroflexota bacterium]|nr:MAG: phosphotransferase [Chloroflexota bacterium]